MVVPPNHPILIGFSIINHPFWGTPIFGNIHIVFSVLVNISQVVYVGIMIFLHLPRSHDT